MTTKKEELTCAVQNLNEENTEIILKLVYKLMATQNEENLNENGEIIIDDFYKKILSDIDENDQGKVFSYEELKKELGIV